MCTMPRVDRRNFVKLAGYSAAGLTVAAGASEAAAKTPKTVESGDELCNFVDPAVTRIKAVELDPRERYPGPPPKVGEHDPDYIQPWNDYDPECTLKDQEICPNVPSQTANIKTAGVYEGIEVGADKWMIMACEEALISVQKGGGPFGVVILQIDDDSQEIIRYWRNHNHVTQWNDPTAHAEVSTIRCACAQLQVFDLGNITDSALPQPGSKSHCVIYSSAESCPMCYAAISWARIKTVVFAATRYDSAAQGVSFSDETIYADLAVPYRERTNLHSFHSTTPNSLDAFNYWKRSKKIDY